MSYVLQVNIIELDDGLTYEERHVIILDSPYFVPRSNLKLHALQVPSGGYRGQVVHHR